MWLTNIQSRLVAAFVGALLCLAWLVGGAESGAYRVAVAAVPLDTACESKADEAWLVMQRQQAREERTQRLREREEGRQERELLQEHRAIVHKDMARRDVAARGIADLVPEEYQNLVLDVAAQYDLDPRLIAAVGMVESRWRPWVVGTQNDTGLMQILPSTGRWIAGRLGLEKYDLFDPATNVNMGAWYLRILIDEYGSWEEALAAYNGGPRAAHHGADWPYTRKVLRVYNSRGT